MIGVFLSVALLASAQEGTKVDALLAEIKPDDSRAAFRAIAALSSLPEKRLEEVRAGAAKLPAFYRDALLSELEVRERLGEHAGRVIRAKVSGGEKSAVSHLDEFNRASGMKISPGYRLKQGAGESISIVAGERPAMEILAELCRLTHHYPYPNRSSTIALNQAGVKVEPFSFRNFAFFVSSLQMRRRIDFSDRSPWKIKLTFIGINDPGIAAAAWAPEFRLIEAVTDKGVKLPQDDLDSDTALRFTDTPRKTSAVARSPGFTVVLRLSGGASEKLARIRGVATARIARRTTRLELKEFEPLSKARTKDEFFDVAVVDVEGGTRYQPETLIRVVPRTMTPEALLDLPVRIDLSYQGTGEGQCWVEGKIVEKAVEYRVRWWPQEYRPRPDNQHPTLERLVMIVPMDFVDRPVYVELTDIPLK